MEKMDSTRRCQHPKKVFAPIGMALLSDPPIRQSPWICQDCGEEGIDIMSQKDVQPTYSELRQRKARGGFSRGS